ncbi:5952_t:CDS:2 [Funneliformis caledonium]|uniref:5952_t:CDS:1 n=1 Tax=Funneliformis caledonium TaxID=1117310 RepID=A0A9N8ZQ65_9GLOM|nr:5952_t:CDS:2 [Funneliformis caledonium]
MGNRKKTGQISPHFHSPIAPLEDSATGKVYKEVLFTYAVPTLKSFAR